MARSREKRGAGVPLAGVMHRLRLLVVAAVVGALGVVVLPAPPAHAASITVNTALDIAPNAEGKFPTDGLCSLRAAIQSAQANSNVHDVDCPTGAPVPNVLDVIQIAPSLAGSTVTLTYQVGGVVQPLPVIEGPTNPLEIIGPTLDAADFVISGGNAVRPFIVGYLNVSPGDLSLANLTVAHGNGANGLAGAPAVDGQGGALYAGEGSQLAFDNVVFRNNSPTAGAGVKRGGAIYAERPTITNNGGAYVDNSAGEGGAIFISSGPATFNGYAMLLESNAATDKGGAIAVNPGAATSFVHLDRSLIRDNSAPTAGVMYIAPVGAPTAVAFELEDSTVTGNSSVFATTATTQRYNFERTTFVSTGTIFSGSGGGTVANSIIKGSGCTTNTAISNYVGFNNLIDDDTTCDLSAMGNLGTVTGLASTLAQNGGPDVQQTFALSAGSNAIDRGDPTYCGTVDVRSVPRGVDGNGTLDHPVTGDCDIGAYEFALYVVNFVTGTSSVNEASGSANVALELTVPDPANTPIVAPVNVTISPDPTSTATFGADGDYELPSATVTFPSGSSSGATANLVVDINQDDVAELFGEQIYLDITGVSEGVAVAEPRRHTLSIQDDDQAGVLVDDGGNGTTIAEATALAGDSVTVRLQSRPDRELTDPDHPGHPDSYGPPADVDMTVTPDRDCTIDLDGQVGTSASPVTVTILNADWQTGRTIDVFAVQDLYDEDFRNEAEPHVCELRFTFASADPIYDSTHDAYEVDVTDDDVAGVNVDAAGPSQVLAEGSDDALLYDVSLDTPPDPGKPLPATPRGPTGVVLTPTAGCTIGNAGAGVPVTRWFTEADYDTPQQIEVRAADNLVVELLHTCSVTTAITSPDPVYADLDDPPTWSATPPTLTAQIQDYDPPSGIEDDPPFVVVDTGTGGADVDEAAPGTPDVVSVVLERSPLGQPVTVTVTAADDPLIDGPQLTVAPVSVPAVPASPAATLTFTPANWNVPQLVEVHAVDDDYDEDDLHAWNLAVTMDSTAPGFSSNTLRRIVVDGVEYEESAPVTVSIADDDTSAIVPGGDPSVGEAGGTDTATVQLATHPYNDVTVVVTADPQCTVEGGTSTDVPILADDWNVPVSIEVAAVDDVDLEGPHQCTLTYEAQSDDAKYHGLTATDEVDIVDDEEPIVTVTAGGALAVAEGGLGDSFDVVLGARPSADVTIGFVHAGQTTSSPPSVTFTPADWYVAQTVAVDAFDDVVDEDDPHATTVGFTVDTTAVGFATAPILVVDGVPSATVPPSATVAVADNDTAAVTVDTTSLALVEGGPDATYTVVLETEPAAPVTVQATAAGLCTVAPPELTFTASDWDEPQTFSVTPGDDDIDADAQGCVITHGVVSGDSKYTGLDIAAVTGDVADDDVAGISVTTLSAELHEAEPAVTAAVAVVLDTEPAAPVTVSTSVPDSQATAAPSSLTFTAATWDVPQTVTVTVVDDVLVETSPHPTAMHLASSSADAKYASAVPLTVDGTPAAAVPFSIGDDETTTTLHVIGSPVDALPLRVRAVVAGDFPMSGSVQFVVDGVDVGAPVDVDDSGEAIGDLGVWPTGAYTVTASYLGDARHEPSTASMDVTVNVYVPPLVPVDPAETEPACDPTAPPPFDDVDPASAHAAAIACVHHWGLANGVGDRRFDPGGWLTRAQAATLVSRLLDRAGIAAEPAPDAFADDDGSVHEPSIDRLAALGIVSGVAPGAYDPGGRISRAQFAALIDGTWLVIAGAGLDAGPDAFDDDDGSIHEAMLDRLAAAGIATGVAPRRFAPDVDVRRDQAASFLARLLDRLVEESILEAP